MNDAPPSNSMTIPSELEPTRAAALRAVEPLRPADKSTQAQNSFLFNGQRTDAGRKLPPYYLVYFLLVDLLGFRDLGRFEKLAWSVPVDLNGEAFLIEHRKFGVGVFARDAAADNYKAAEIVRLIHKGVKAAEPFFEWLADRAVQTSKLNVRNNSRSLFSRFEYFRDAYREADAEAIARSEERHVEKRGDVTITHFPVFALRDNARWLALAAIDAFFSWTEHVFIHIGILSGAVTTGVAVAELAEGEWQKKFKQALDISDHRTKELFDQLIDIRRQLRNFLAHGAFGKQGEAFHFHSGAGAVPVLLPHRAGSRSRFSLTSGLAFDESDALKIIEDFIDHLWSGVRQPAKLYIQDAELPVILTMAANGTYAEAMRSLPDMQEFVDQLTRQMDDAANMDW